MRPGDVRLRALSKELCPGADLDDFGLTLEAGSTIEAGLTSHLVVEDHAGFAHLDGSFVIPSWNAVWPVNRRLVRAGSDVSAHFGL